MWRARQCTCSHRNATRSRLFVTLACVFVLRSDCKRGIHYYQSSFPPSELVGEGAFVGGFPFFDRPFPSARWFCVVKQHTMESVVDEAPVARRRLRCAMLRCLLAAQCCQIESWPRPKRAPTCLRVDERRAINVCVVTFTAVLLRCANVS